MTATPNPGFAKKSPDQLVIRGFFLFQLLFDHYLARL